MSTDMMHYDKLVEAALRRMMADVLRGVAKKGLPGDHHFYIALRTDHPGVRIPASLRARFPEELTIVLQHQYDDLDVDEDGFSVTLSFDGIKSGLTVPFASVTAFSDPSVKFGLQFQVAGASPTATGESAHVASVERSAGGDEAPDGDGDEPGGGERRTGEVVTLDTFRKK